MKTPEIHFLAATPIRRLFFIVTPLLLLFSSASAAVTKNVIVHLFEWKWNDIKNECSFLEEKGYGAVQVSPPNEHAVKADAGYPWWQRYQPVSYELTRSRSGTQVEFEDMVKTCWKDHGVKIYVDAVINHMAAGHGDGSIPDGRPYTEASHYYLYTDSSGNEVFYKSNHFHPECPIDWDQSFVPADEIQKCWVADGGLPDLRTEDGANDVKPHIVHYLNRLIDMGVAGFRIDAAKHMHPHDIISIVSNLHDLRSDSGWFASGSRPFIYQEVIYGDRQGVQPGQYDNSVNGKALNVTELRYGNKLGEKFRHNEPGTVSDFLKHDFPIASSGWDMLDSLYAVVFVDNHDNQRGHGSGHFFGPGDNDIGGILTHFYDGGLYNLANVFMLAWPYGTPKVMSSYDWDRDVRRDGDKFRDFNDGAGPPSGESGKTKDVDCSEGWVCEHRWTSIAGMVGFNNYAQDAWDIGHTWHNNDQIAFARVTDSGESRAFVVINRESGTLSRAFQTGLPGGTYCDIARGSYNFVTKECAPGSPAITVDDSGMAEITVSGMQASAIHIGAPG